MLVEPLLRGLVVIGRDHQYCICARLLRMAGELDCLCRRIRPGSRNDRNAPLRLLNTPSDDLPVFLVRERRTLAGCAHRHQTVSALRDLPIHKAAKSLLVERAVAEGGHQRGKRASKARPDGHDAILRVVKGRRADALLHRQTANSTATTRKSEPLLPGTAAKKRPCRLFAAVRVDGSQLSPSSSFYQISIPIPANR